MRNLFIKVSIFVFMAALASVCPELRATQVYAEASGINLKDVKPAKEIIFWSTDKNSFKDVADEFEKQTGIKVTGTYMGGYDDMVNKVMAGIRSKNLPDVAQLGQRHGLAQFYDSKTLLPVEEFVSPELISDILPGFWKRFTYKGKKVIMPFQNSMPVLYYNKALIEKAGVKLPETFEELQNAAAVIKEKTELSGFSTDKDTSWYINALAYNSGVSFVTDDNKAVFNTPETVAVFNAYRDMASKGIMPKAQHNTAVEDFSNGQIGMIMASCASYKKITGLVGDKFEVGVVMFPGVKVMDIPMGGNGLGLFNSTPEKIKASIMFIEFMLDRDRVANNTLKSGYIPVTNAAMQTEAYQNYLSDPNRAVVNEQLKHLGGRGVNPADSIVWNELQGIVEKVEVDPAADIEKVLKESEKKVQEYLDGYKG